MDKKTFIRELKQALSVLQEEELDDIVSEYEQHIDMKQASGLTEEEAIADFGSLNKLAADILEAYHVRADYAAAREGQESSSGEHRRRKVFAKTKEICARFGNLLGAGMRKMCGWVKNSWHGTKRFLAGSIRWMSGLLPDKTGEKCREATEGISQAGEKADGRKRRGRTAGNQEKGGLQTGMFERTGKLMGRIILFCCEMSLWMIGILWNGICIVGVLCCSLFGGCCLFGLGILAVLLLQGYPLAGVTLACLGAAISSFSAAWLGMTLLWRRKKPEETEKPVSGDDKPSRPLMGSGQNDEFGQNKEDGYGKMEARQHA